MQKYCITFHEHGDYYDFYYSQETVSEFLTVFENNCVLRLNVKKVRFKCSFMLINRQPPPYAGMVELTASRIWLTNVYKGVYFNDFIKANQANVIKKRIIVNGLTGSSWR